MEGPSFTSTFASNGPSWVFKIALNYASNVILDLEKLLLMAFEALKILLLILEAIWVLHMPFLRPRRRFTCNMATDFWPFLATLEAICEAPLAVLQAALVATP